MQIRFARRGTLRQIAMQAAVLFALCGSVRGLGTFDGRDEAEWTGGKAAVVLALVQETGPSASGVEHQATFVPRATLAGSFDCSQHPRLRMRFFASETGGTSIKRAPAEGDLVLVVIGTGAGDDGYQVYSEYCAFMPGGEAMLTVRGIDDPRVAETLRKVQELRAQLKREAGATTKPSAERGR